MRRLDGKRVVITGGTSGIGLATARRFRENGARVLIAARDAGRLAAAREALGDDVEIVRADVSRLADLDALAQAAGRLMGGVDVAFLNAGATGGAPVGEITEEMFDSIIGTNVKGVLFAAQSLAPLLSAGASVIVTTSSAHRLGYPNLAVYAASKAAARAIVRVLAAELAPRRIRVNAVRAGPVDTPILKNAGLPDDMRRAVMADMAGRTAFGRLADADEIAAVALFLASEQASYVTGTEIAADAGWTDLGNA